MKMKLVYLMAAVVALNFSTSTRADDNAPQKPEGRSERPGGPGREEFARKLGLNPEELQKLSPEERQAKFKEAVQKKMAELEKKKADGTITDEEKQMLQRMEERKKAMAEGRGPGGPGGPAGNREEMGKMLKDLGLNRDDLQNLSPEERRAKIKEAADKKFAELQKKQQDGSITDSEKEMLKRMEERRARWQGGHGGPGGKPDASK